MKLRRLALLAAVSLPLASFLLPADEVEFRPSEGTKVSRSIDITIDVVIDEAVTYMNGEEQDIGLTGEEGATLTLSIAVTDEFAAMDDGRPTDLLRTFDEISGSVEAQPDDVYKEGSLDDVEGSTVRFKWDEEEGEYIVTFEDGGGDEEILDVLAIDMDYQALLPDGAVSEDDEWEVAGRDVFSILIPGIDIGNLDEARMRGEEIPAEILDALDEFLSGVSLTCTYQGTSISDDVEVGEIAISGEISGAIDIDPSAFDDSGNLDDGEVSITMAMDVEGTLLWNLAGGHFHSFELKGDGTIDAEVLIVIPGFDMEFEMIVSVSISLEQTASATSESE
ncbi:MAG: hypothetical protein O7B99_13030 [Planctomycetota bacterium]|nr:hypothetical protein [Planctomycetota bacterium]